MFKIVRKHLVTGKKTTVHMNGRVLRLDSLDKAEALAVRCALCDNDPKAIYVIV